jgi:hypothetical protein
VTFEDLRDIGLRKLIESGEYDIGVINQIAHDPEKVFRFQKEHMKMTDAAARATA